MFFQTVFYVETLAITWYIFVECMPEGLSGFLDILPLQYSQL